MGSVQLRAVRNGVIAAVVTALVGFGVGALFTTGAKEDAASGTIPPTPTSRPTPSCRPAVVPVPHADAPRIRGRLLGVTIIGPRAAWAVGALGGAPTSSTAEAASWNGRRWVPAQVPSISAVDVLRAVDGAAPDDVWAVGSSGSGRAPDALTEHWDGTSWNHVRAPSGASLYGGVTLAPDDAWAVGATGDPSAATEHALALHWDGASWTPAAIPVGAGRSLLSAVDGTAGDLWAVGYQRNAPLVLHFDGSSWNRTLHVGAKGTLSGVAVAADGTVWVVGSSVLRYEGKNWSVEVPAARGTTYAAVAADAHGTAWVVGTRTTSTGTSAVVLYLDGSGAAAARVRIAGNDSLGAVSVAGAIAWAVGSRTTASNGAQPLLVSLARCGPPASPSPGQSPSPGPG